MLLLSNIRRIIGSGKLIVLDILVYSFICGTNLQLAKETGMTSFEYVLHCVTNHYFLLYFLLIVYLLLITQYLRQTQDIQIIRYESKKRWMQIESLSLLLFSLLFSGIHFIIPCVIGLLKLPFSSGFLVNSKMNAWNEMLELLVEYRNWFSSPVIASICAVLFLAMGLWLISIILRKVLTEFGIISALILMGGIVINTTLGLKTDLDDFAFPLFINKYLILHHTLFSNGWIGVFLIICVPCLLFAVFGINFHLNRRYGKTIMVDDQQHLSIALINNLNMKKMIGVTFVYCLVNAISLLFIEKAPGMPDFVLYMFVGGSEKSIALRDLLSYIFMMSVPVYFIAVYEETIRTYQSTPMLIRYEKKSHLEHAIWKIEIRFIFVYFLILLGSIQLIGIGLSLKSGLLFGQYITDVTAMLGIGLQSTLFLLVFGMVLRAAELFLIVILFRWFRSMTENTSLSFICALSGYVFLLFPMRLNLFLPYGAGSLTRIAYFYNGNRLAPYLAVALISCTIALIANWSIDRKGVRK